MGLQQLLMANMKKRRKQLGLTQEKLAEMCDTDACYIRQIEIGYRNPSLEYLERIANALDIEPYLLFYNETSQETDKYLSQSKEQKQKFKAMLIENVNKLCAAIDEQL
jgi:transcriptional regulator with XRE-family HTH domain